jgi:ferritin-like metal-binding protein YciE
MDRSTPTDGGRGIDLPRESRPGVPMETQPAHEESTTRAHITQQEERKPHLHRKDLDGPTPVFGTGPAPRALSGVMRRAAYAMPEHQARRWMLLLAADRVDVLEHRIPELMTGRSWDALGRQVKANPVGMLGMAFGVGFLLQRTNLLPGILSAATGALFRGDEEPKWSRRHTPAEQKLLEWLNDAYAMELAIVPVLENHANDAKRHPDIRRRDLRHLKETKQHAKDVKKCIEHLGEKPSATKKVIGRMTGAMQSLATEPFEDEIMKNFLTDYATEHFEIACYKSLISAAKEAGHPKIARVCEEILEEELDMAEWIEENLDRAVHITIS